MLQVEDLVSIIYILLHWKDKRDLKILLKNLIYQHL